MKKEIAGFSLVEVTIALGIISFCVISVFALLPIGMNTIKQARDNRNGVELINQVTSELVMRRAAGQDRHALAGIFSNVSWQVGAPTIETNVQVMADGRYSIAAGGEKMQAWLKISPPVNAWSVGLAQVSVAWPESAKRVGDSWTNSQGSVDGVIYFNP